MSVFGWSYPPGAENDPKPIKSVRDLARNCYCWDDEDGVSAIKAVESGVYKYTYCGASERIRDGWAGSVCVAGSCEGSDAEHPTHTLTFPFSESEWFEALDQCETESEETWNSTHGCERCWPEGFCTENEELEFGCWPINPKCTNCNGDGVIL